MTKKEQKPDLEIQRLLSAGKIKAVLCAPLSGRYASRDVEIILFEDGETYIRLEEQDYYSYHDCATSARHIEVQKDKEAWESYNRDYVPAMSLT